MSDGMERLEQYPDVSFIEGKSFDAFLSELVEAYGNEYRKQTGLDAQLAAADPIRLVLYSCSVMLYQALQYIDRAGKMGLLKYSTGEFLDNLAAMKNTERLPAQPAVTTVRFTLSAVRSQAVKIPKGTRVKGGELFFAVTEAGSIPEGEKTVDLPVECLTAGTAGNGFLPGEIQTLVDPVHYIAKVSNLTESSGGSDAESDEALAERIYLAPSKYSTAGPEDAYRYWVMSYSSAIQDCRIASDSPGEVDIYVILSGGELPDEAFLSGLSQELSGSSRRPLTDKVVVKAPQKQEYQIEATYYIGKENQGMEAEIKARAEAACQNYVSWQKAAIGRDINPSRLMYELMQAGIKWADIKSPAFTQVTGDKVAVASKITLTYGGLQDD